VRVTSNDQVFTDNRVHIVVHVSGCQSNANQNFVWQVDGQLDHIEKGWNMYLAFVPDFMRPVGFLLQPARPSSII